MWLVTLCFAGLEIKFIDGDRGLGQVEERALLEKPGLYEYLYMQTEDELMQAETSTKRSRETATQSV
jgi:hypothetical protein